MTEHHMVADMQKEIGGSGRVGEAFVALGLVILLGGIALLAVGRTGYFAAGPTGAGGSWDGAIAGILFVVEGIGFMVFGAVAILSGWDRHHDHED